MDQAVVGSNLEPESLQYETVTKKESNPPHSQFIDNFFSPTWIYSELQVNNIMQFL